MSFYQFFGESRLPIQTVLAFLYDMFVPPSGLAGSRQESNLELIRKNHSSNMKPSEQGNIPSKVACQADPELITVLKEYVSHVVSQRSFNMGENFHPPPKPQWITERFLKEVEWFVDLAKCLPFPDDPNPRNLNDWLDLAKSLVGFGKVDHYVKTTDPNAQKNQGGVKWKEVHGIRRPGRKRPPRKTCVAIFVIDKRRQDLGDENPFSTYKNYRRARALLSKLAGRLHPQLWGIPFVSAKVFPVAKTGMLPLLLDKWVKQLAGTWDDFVSKYPISYSLLAIVWSNFSARKEFTIESQKQGALNPFEQRLFNLASEKEQDGFKLLALVLPFKETFSKLSSDQLEDVYCTCHTNFELTSLYLEFLWRRGANKGPKRDMVVFSRRSNVGLNTTAWNQIADAFTNLGRFYRAAVEFRGLESDKFLPMKVLQFIAADQKMWFQEVNGNSTNPSVVIFHKLTRTFKPWEQWLPDSSRPDTDVVMVMRTLIKACQENKVHLGSFFGLSSKRLTQDVNQHDEAICGVKTGNDLTPEEVEMLKMLGFCGAGMWTGSEPDYDP